MDDVLRLTPWSPERDVELLTESATSFMEARSENEVYALLGAYLRHVIGEEAIINISQCDPVRQTFSPRVLLGMGPVIEKVTALIGQSPLGLSGDYPPPVKRALATGRLTRVEGGVVELAGGTIAPQLCRQLVALLGLHDVWVVGFARQRLCDGISIIGRRPGMALRHATIEGLARMAGGAIERQRSEEALRVSEGRLREIVHAVPIPMALNDDQGRITFLNPAFVKTFGYTQADIPTLTQWWPRAYPDPAYRARVTTAWQAEFDRAHRTGTDFVPLEFDVRCKDGSVRTVLISAATSAQVAGTEHLVVFLDVTEHQKLKAGLAQADRLSSLGMLAAGVAHEINNPLAYVLANLESLTRDLPRVLGASQRSFTALRALGGDVALAHALGDAALAVSPGALDELVEVARGALEGGLRIRKIAKSLGSFSRDEPVEWVRTDVNQCLETAATMAHHEVKFRARLVKHLGTVPPVLASEGKLAQVFLNLIINAAHAVDDGQFERHSITLRTWAEGSSVCAEVADTGHGIAPEHLGRIFEPFFTTKKPGAGSGLGLAISKSIVTELGGDLRVESVVGQGARFQVRLPAVAARPLPPPPSLGSSTVAPPTRTTRGRVLVVDDEEMIRRSLVRLLRSHHDVVAVSSGREAQALLERDPGFDVVLCDLMMPEMTGMDLHAWLAQTAPALAARVVFVSGGAFTPRASAYLAGVSNLRLDKPFDPAHLERVVEGFITPAPAPR